MSRNFNEMAIIEKLTQSKIKIIVCSPKLANKEGVKAILDNPGAYLPNKTA